MNPATMRKLLALVPFLFFRLQAAGDRMHAARGLSSGLRGLLLSLDEQGPMTVSRLADIRPVSRQAIHKLAEQLIARELISQVENPLDKRSPFLVLTSKGQDELERLRAAEEPEIARLFRGVPQADVDAAIRVLQALSERMAPKAMQQISANRPLKPDRSVGRVRRSRSR